MQAEKKKLRAESLTLEFSQIVTTFWTLQPQHTTIIMEEQLVLRLPPEQAAIMRESIRAGKQPDMSLERTCKCFNKQNTKSVNKRRGIQQK